MAARFKKYPVFNLTRVLSTNIYEMVNTMTDFKDLGCLGFDDTQKAKRYGLTSVDYIRVVPNSLKDSYDYPYNIYAYGKNGKTHSICSTWSAKKWISIHNYVAEVYEDWCSAHTGK